MGRRRDEDNALAVGDGGSCKATDSTIEKLLILIELNYVIARPRAGQQAIPGLPLIQAIHIAHDVSSNNHLVLRVFCAAVLVHGRCSKSECSRSPGGRQAGTPSLLLHGDD